MAGVMVACGLGALFVRWVYPFSRGLPMFAKTMGIPGQKSERLAGIRS